MTLPTHDPGFTTDAMTAVFSPASRVAALCRVEAALARAGAVSGVVPEDAAARIAVACADAVDDPEAVLREGWEDGTPVLPLLARLRSRLDDGAAGWLHHGATTQDVVDTATMLQARDGLAAIRSDLAVLAGDLRTVVEDHRTTPAEGWTFLQPAVATTVGRRAAGWLAPVVEHLRDIRQHAGALPVQLGGPTGTSEVLGEHAPAVVGALADELGLVTPLLPWHTDRTVVDRVVGTLQRVARTTSTIGTDLVLLAHDGAVRMRAGGSSTMPGKRNPIDATRAIAAAEACHGVAAIVTAGRPHELERAVGGWHAEWFAVPLAFQTAAAAVEAVGRAVATLEVVTDGGAPATTPANDVAIDRVLAACDEELRR